MGKAEGQKELWHGHVTAVTVAPEYRRLGVAKQLMDSLETVREGCAVLPTSWTAESERLAFTGFFCFLFGSGHTLNSAG